MLVIYCPKRKQDSKKKKSNRAFEKFSNCRGSQKKKILKGLAVIVDKIKAPRRCSRILKFVPLLFFPTMRYNVRCSQARSLSSAFTATCSRGWAIMNMQPFQSYWRFEITARLMHMREEAHLPHFVQTFPLRLIGYRSKWNRIFCFLTSPKNEHRFRFTNTKFNRIESKAWFTNKWIFIYSVIFPFENPWILKNDNIFEKLFNPTFKLFQKIPRWKNHKEKGTFFHS